MATKYVNATSEQASADCIRRGNPYAHLDGHGNRSAITVSSQDVINDYGFAAMPTISDARVRQCNPYAYLNEDGLLEATATMTVNDEKKSNVPYSSRDEVIENKVRLLRKRIWSNRNTLWPDGVPSDFVDVLDPAVALELLGYDFIEEETLGVYRDKGVDIEVAGVIDRQSHRVSVSRKFLPNVRRFTAAHELGHSVMHKGAVMHRDRPLDGSCVSREKIEAEADKFAAYFLMPEKLVRKRFKEAFCTERFVPTTDAVFAFGQSGTVEKVERSGTLRELSRILAKTERYNGRAFKSLAEQFKVTVEAMAISIEELGLVSLDEEGDLLLF